MSGLPPDFDPVALSGAKAKGKRPWFFNDPDVERVLAITMALAMEHAVTRQRLDALERLIEAKGLLTRAELDAFAPSIDAENERTRWMRAYVARILRIVQQDAEAAGKASSTDRSMAEVMDDLRHS